MYSNTVYRGWSWKFNLRSRPNMAQLLFQQLYSTAELLIPANITPKLLLSEQTLLSAHRDNTTGSISSMIIQPQPLPTRCKPDGPDFGNIRSVIWHTLCCSFATSIFSTWKSRLANFEHSMLPMPVTWCIFPAARCVDKQTYVNIKWVQYTLPPLMLALCFSFTIVPLSSSSWAPA
jgi:hypothetical protein